MTVNGQVTEVGLAVKAGGERIYLFVTMLTDSGEFNYIYQVVSSFNCDSLNDIQEFVTFEDLSGPAVMEGTLEDR
jgi:hypothetical protein